MKRIPWLLVTLILVVGVSSLPASADTFFSNFGQNNDYNCCVGGTIGGQNSPVGWIIQANEFTAAISGNVSQIDVAVGFVTGTNGATVSLWTDSAGIPTAMLGSWDLTNLPNFGSCCAVGTITGISGINLAAGTNYFLMVSAPDPTWDAWNYNSTGDVGLVDYTFDGGQTWNQAPGSTRYAFDVLGGGGGGGVPEPASLIMFGSGLLAAAGTIRRRFQR
jgi:hypothetical protein